MMNQIVKTLILMAGILTIPISQAGIFSDEPPSLEAEGSVAGYKEALIDFAVNNLKTRHKDIIQTRDFLTEVLNTDADERSVSSKRFLTTQKEKYGIDDEDKLKDVIDVIPMGLKVALFIHFTEWGQNGLLRDYNNPFGVKDESGELIKFSSLDNGIRAFQKNVMTDPAFQSMRNERKKIKKSGKQPVSVDLVEYFFSDFEIDAVNQLIMEHKLYYLD